MPLEPDNLQISPEQEELNDDSSEHRQQSRSTIAVTPALEADLSRSGFAIAGKMLPMTRRARPPGGSLGTRLVPLHHP